MNDRQLKVVLKMFDYGAALFKGDMTAQKYQSIAKTSKATATRDLQDLTEKGALLKTGSGRGVKYKLNL